MDKEWRARGPTCTDFHATATSSSEASPAAAVQPRSRPSSEQYRGQPSPSFLHSAPLVSSSTSVQPGRSPAQPSLQANRLRQINSASSACPASTQKDLAFSKPRHGLIKFYFARSRAETRCFELQRNMEAWDRGGGFGVVGVAQSWTHCCPGLGKAAWTLCQFGPYRLHTFKPMSATAGG